MKNNKLLYGIAAISVGLAAAVSSWYFLIYKKSDSPAAASTDSNNGNINLPAGNSGNTGVGGGIPNTPPVVISDPAKFYIGDELYATTDTPLLKSAQVGASNIATTVNAGQKIGTFLSWDGNYTKVARTEGLLFKEAVNYYIYKTAKIHK